MSLPQIVDSDSQTKKEGGCDPPPQADAELPELAPFDIRSANSEGKQHDKGSNKLSVK